MFHKGRLREGPANPASSKADSLWGKGVREKIARKTEWARIDLKKGRTRGGHIAGLL